MPIAGLVVVLVAHDIGDVIVGKGLLLILGVKNMAADADAGTGATSERSRTQHHESNK